MSQHLTIKFKKTHPDAVIPSYAMPGDAGLDLTAVRIIANTTSQITYGLGLSVEIPDGYVGLIFPRSSVRNYELILSNCVGVIDSKFRGELQVTFNKTNGLDSIAYKPKERICQMIIMPYPTINCVEVDELGMTDRGTGGFGSTNQPFYKIVENQIGNYICFIYKYVNGNLTTA